MATPGNVAVDSTADLSKQHSLCCLRRDPLAFFLGHVSEHSTGRAVLRGLSCCVERFAVLSTATMPGLVIPTLYLVLNIRKINFQTI